MKEEGGSHYTYRHIRRYSYFRKLPFAILWAVIVVNQVQQMSMKYCQKVSVDDGEIGRKERDSCN